jgi:hypothetical protein
MKTDTDSTRRSFLKGGALLAVPLAAALPATVLADDGTKARLARLEDEAAIRELHQAWLRRIKAGEIAAAERLLGIREDAALGQTVRSIAADPAGEPEAIEVAADGRSAIGRFHCAVEIETAIAQDCTLAQMAREQGGGFVSRTERGVLQVEYGKALGAWAITKAEFATA